ncbi:ankyrin repeat domain-containing protein 45 [Lampris incognitus]|uniref:ankyrin repeat domain-containing protein 45 n=1 Tax=Lampris incognitus TaxID=2546036 RepID=UPI0024B5F3E3|nr:ankyrin repeat domain-containing protein 45 [Lampris incognitus]
MASKQEEIFNCVLAGDLKNLQQHLENENGGEEAKEGVKFEFTDEMGRNALFAACSLGRSAIVRELVKHGARLNKCTARGYSPLHCATCWGHLETVKTLLDLGANPQAKNFRGERPVDVAKRYSHTDCADCLDLAEAKQDFLSYISYVTDTIFDRENTQGIQVKFNKEEKNKCMNACSTMSDWIQNVKNPTLSDYTAQRKHMEDTLQPILSKLSAQSAQAPAK